MMGDHAFHRPTFATPGELAAYMRGRQHGQAARDELLDLAVDLAVGFAAALEQGPESSDPDLRLQAAVAAAGRLQAISEAAGA